MGEWKTTKVNDGSEMRLYVARPKGTVKSGIIVFQEIFGVNSHIREVANRFAELGFLAVAPDLFHREDPGFESGYSEAEMGKARELMGKYNAGQMAEDIKASYEWLKGELGSDNIVATGYCMGGKLSFLANAMLPLKGAISYYGGITSIIEQAKNQHGPLLMFWGGKDKHLGREAPHKVGVALSEAEKVYTNVVFSDADHGFNCDQRPAFHKESADRAWLLVKEFLQTKINL